MSELRNLVLAELARGTHSEAFADGARWVVQEAEKLQSGHVVETQAKMIERLSMQVMDLTKQQTAKREYVTGYLMDGRTVDLIKSAASRCANLEPHEVHWPDFKVGQGNPRVSIEGTYVCPGVPPRGVESMAP